jgi:hypothetical protein
MDLLIHPITNAPPPHTTAWVDDVLATVRGEAGALVGRAMSMPNREVGVPGVLITLWEDDAATGSAAATAVETPGGTRVDLGRRYPVTARGSGRAATGPARYLQMTWFDGPRAPEWTATFDIAGTRRIWPAIREVPGVVASVVGVAQDGATVALTLAESVEALEEAVRRINATTPLPGEDAAQLTGPDRVEILRLLHAALPTHPDT